MVDYGGESEVERRKKKSKFGRLVVDIMLRAVAYAANARKFQGLLMGEGVLEFLSVSGDKAQPSF